MRRTTRTPEDLRELAAVARGDLPADLLLEGGQVLNVYSAELLPVHVGIVRGRIAYVGDRRLKPGPHTAALRLEGRTLVPGYIDPHAHPPGFANPVALAEAVLPLGTTAIVMDTLHLLLHGREETLPETLEWLSRLPLHFYWYLRLHPQGHDDAEDRMLGPDILFGPDRLQRFLEIDSVRAVGEVTRWPALAAGDPDITMKVGMGLAAGRRVEGHAPGAGADRLATLAAAGLSSDHEAITADQALDRLRAGLYVMLRYSSIRRDLPHLASIAVEGRAHSARIMMTPDGPNPLFIEEEGYMDRLIAIAMEAGVTPTAAYQMATLNAATYYGLDEEIGGIAPGRIADLNVLSDLSDPRPQMVIAGGQVVAESCRLVDPLGHPEWEQVFRPTYRAGWTPGPELFDIPAGESVPAMHLENEVITRRREIEISRGALPDGVLRMALLDPQGHWVSRGLLSGFARRLEGLASTFSIARGVTVLGTSPEAMAAAAQRALALGGGVVLLEGNTALFEVALPLGGMMTPGPFAEVTAAVRRLTTLLKERGYPHGDVLYSLLFLSFDSLPDLRLTARGLWDVKRQQVLYPRELLPASGL